VEDGTANAAYYKYKILPMYIVTLKDPALFLQQKKVPLPQDGASAYTAIVVTRFLESQSLDVWEKGVWPGNYPNFPPIATLWAIVKDAAYKPPYPSSKAELFTRFKREWEKISLTTLENLAQSLKGRVQKMFDANGGHSKH